MVWFFLNFHLFCLLDAVLSESQIETMDIYFSICLSDCHKTVGLFSPDKIVEFSINSQKWHQCSSGFNVKTRVGQAGNLKNALIPSFFFDWSHAITQNLCLAADDQNRITDYKTDWAQFPLGASHQDSLQNISCRIPYIYDSFLAACGHQFISFRINEAWKGGLMTASDISKRVVLIVVISWKNNDSWVLWATKNNIFLRHIDYFRDWAMLIDIIDCLQFLNELPRLRWVFSDKTSSIANIYFSAFWSKFSSRNDEFTLLIGQGCQNLFESPS